MSTEALSATPGRVRSALLRKPVIAWALCDWANSAFATTVMAGFFPLYFKQYWNAGVEATESTFRLGLANGIASLIIAMKLTASFSKRVTILRDSFSQPMHRSMTLRLL